MLENIHKGNKQCLGQVFGTVRVCRGSVDPKETHQDRTSASDGPTDCMGCPVDSVLAKESGLFDGSGVFRWTLWSRHVCGLDEGDANCSGGDRALDPSEVLPSDGQQGFELGVEGVSAQAQSQGWNDCAGEGKREVVVVVAVSPPGSLTWASHSQSEEKEILSTSSLAYSIYTLRVAMAKGLLHFSPPGPMGLLPVYERLLPFRLPTAPPPSPVPSANPQSFTHPLLPS